MKKKIAYLLLVTMIVLQMQVPTFAFSLRNVGDANLEVTLQLDYPVANNQKSKIKLDLLDEKGTIVASTKFNNQSEKGYEAVFENLGLGVYQVRLEAPGYKTYESDPIEIKTHEKHLVLGTGDATFTSGDINQDGLIDELDIQEIESLLGKDSENAKADLNSDGKVDIEDLSQAYWNQMAEGKAEIYNTRLILSEVANTEAIVSDIEKDNGSRVEVDQGEISNLFDGSEDTELVLKNTTGNITPENPVKLPISFNEEFKVSEIRLTGTPTEGNVVYIDENGQEVRVPFVAETPEARGLFRGFRSKGNTISINLGKQVPIQKITIEVTGTENGNHLAAISKIEFLEDVVDNAVNQEQAIIKGFKGRSKNEAVELVWNNVPNVTGYKVSYGTESGQYQETMYPSKNSALVGGLENFTPYYFVVQAINGDWEGPLSEEIMVEPKPEQKPGAPQNIQISPADSALTVTWRNGDDAEGSHVYYKKKGASEYTKISNISSDRQTILGLENGQTYMVYVTAFNSAGESVPSQIVEGVPVQDEFEIPNVPTHKEIAREHIQKIELRDSSNVDMQLYPNGFSVENMLDKDYRTHWTASTYQKSRGIKVTFDKPYEMDYMAFTTRLDKDLQSNRGWYKQYPHWYGIRIWESEGAQPKEVVASAKGSTLIPPSGEEGLFILPFPKSTVYQIEVILYEWDGAGNISISEAMFYEYYDLVERIDNLFADGTYTKLRADITLEDITALEAELNSLQGARLQVDEQVLREELQLAKELAQTGTSKLIEEIVIVNQERNPAKEGDRQFANGRGLSGLQPTGVMAHADEQIVVYVDAPAGGELPTMVFSQFYGDGAWRKSVSLKQGRNVIKVPRIVNYNGAKGGAVYLEYTGEAQEEIRVHIRKAQLIPTLEILDLDKAGNEAKNKQEVRQYIEELTAYVGSLTAKDLAKDPNNSTEIGTEKILLSVPAEGVLKGISQGIEDNIDAQVDRLYETLLTWEANLELHYEILGLTKDAVESKHRWPNTRINVRYMPMNPGVFMYAAADHIGIPYGPEKGLVNDSRASKDGYFGWGINHEIGHIINTNEYIYGEITNNIFAIFSQTINGGKSRLENDGTYTSIYEKVVSKDTGLASNVFVTLGMFWQLHLAYDDMDGFEGINAFYPRLNRLFRDDQTTGIDRHNMLARLASDVVGKDLSPFFGEWWDLPLTKETKDYTSKYEEETRAIYYLNDDAKRYRDNKGEAVDYTELNLSATSEIVKDTDSDDLDALITISHDKAPVDHTGISGILGYEIYRNDELIAFTTEKTYRDELPGGNNVEYQYEVVAYDKLLNRSKKVDAGSVYVATEGILDKSHFTMEKTTPGMITIEMNTVQEVVGVKVQNVTTGSALAIQDGKFKVEISENGIDWTTAKQTELEIGDNLLYFNKPGTSSEDQRIWTYDAKYIRITGMDVEQLDLDQIDLLQYPGDAVYFTEGAIGRLGHDYIYNGGVIKKGSLVVLGTYRGHPVYSKIVLSAKYVSDKDYDESEKPNHENETFDSAVNGELFLFAELPEDEQVSKVNNGIWLFTPADDTLPAKIKANMYRTDEAESIEGGRLVSDTPWLSVPDLESLPTINLN